MASVGNRYRKLSREGTYHASSACCFLRDLNLREFDVTVSVWRAHPETYGRCITVSSAAVVTLYPTCQLDQIIRGSELACIAVNLIHGVKAFQASKDEDKNTPQLIANMQAGQFQARKAWESMREVRKLEESLDEKLREVKRLKQKLEEKTEGVKRLKDKLDEKTHAIEKLKNEIGQRKNKWRGLLDSLAM
ncbi:hypothetical protein FPCIR_8457 [Fusarium pseudocircinatum]|uniref:Uncharacterized protein n=1 Tax=Fusarium pseudocircinatum TaxID=56676 RepID=A0A8H5P0A7_9HYPO|nr:hypothetical protein FPCIR_8457 [Fusarium pseudocircinatum]